MWCREKKGGGGVVLALRVRPCSTRQGIGPVEGDTVTVRLNAPPVEGKANKALVSLLAESLDIAKSRIEIVSGARGRNKVVSVEGLSPADVMSRLKVSR